MTNREVEVLTHLLELLENQKRDPGKKTSLSRTAVYVLARSVPKAPSRDDKTGWLEYERLLALCIEEEVVITAEDQIKMLLSLEADLREDWTEQHELDRCLASGGAETEAQLDSSRASNERDGASRDRYRSEWYRYTRWEDTDLEGN